MRVTNCPSCDSASSKELFEAREYILCGVQKYRLVECNNCHLVFLNPQPTEEEMRQFYPLEFFCQPEDKFKTRAPSILFLDKVRQTLRFKEKGALLDIGCGPGGFLQQMQKLGWEVCGVDVTTVICRMAEERVGKGNIFEGDFCSLNLPLRQYDVITLWQAIEHLHNPTEALRKISALLKDDGILIICCPNFNSYLRKVFREKWYPLCIPIHLFHFTSKTLRQTLQECGYTVKLQKKRFIDPFINMGSFKESTLRFFGLKRLAGAKPPVFKEQDAAHRESIFWQIGRFWFNMFCLTTSFILSALGNEETILVWAAKSPKESK